MNMGVCLGVCEIIEHDNLANNQSIMILYSILQGPFKVSPYAQLQRTVTRGTVFLLPANVLPHKDFVGSPL